MTVLSEQALKDDINSRLADNNAGLISAADVRENIYNIVDSLKPIVASGNFNVTHPFVNDVRLKISADETSGGSLIVESGIIFSNPIGNNGIQVVPYPGANGIQHGGLSGLTVGDPHPQYLKLTGNRNMDANLGMGPKTNWINSSGITMTNNMHGISFEYVSTTAELMHVASGTSANFDIDNSKMSSAKGCAQAWIRFNGSGNMEVLSSYNVTKLQRTGSDGKFKVFFKPNTFADSNYVAVGSSNARSDNDTGEDFSHNTVGIVDRQPEYVTFYVLDDAGTYINASVNDLIVFGNASGVTPATGVTIEIL
ncbi:MAG: hypothetical protein EBU90_05910 [Proteobacteria bacterium]|nr:hypothetical protein [Pseudomonadota bacterium]NBP15044.1 hypothetical protein [bacterium]